nr:MAG TPA: hypothetical protein [Caudoviricetes sp.]
MCTPENAICTLCFFLPGWIEPPFNESLAAFVSTMQLSSPPQSPLPARPAAVFFIMYT